MIREYRPDDIERVLAIWLAASIQAHNFIEPGFWESNVADMREVYIPASETMVFETAVGIEGFYCLRGNALAALFVAPDSQRRGIGSILMQSAQQRRANLELAVYKANTGSIAFYRNHGFSITAERLDAGTGHPELIMRCDAGNG